MLGFDYGYQAPRAVSQYQAWSRERVVAIQGWGTADTEALVRFVTPILEGEEEGAADERLRAFMAEALPRLPAFIPE